MACRLVSARPLLISSDILSLYNDGNIVKPLTATIHILICDCCESHMVTYGYANPYMSA